MPRTPQKPAGYHWDSVDPIVREDGRPPCRECRGPVYPPRKVWCSAECSDEWRLRASGQAGCRWICERRDRGVCALCRLDTRAIEREFKDSVAAAQAAYLGLKIAELQSMGCHPNTIAAARRNIPWKDRAYRQIAVTPPGSAGFRIRYGRRIWKALMEGRTLWNADHIVPLAEGGAWHDESNLRSICIECHVKESAALAGRLAARRRHAKPRG